LEGIKSLLGYVLKAPIVSYLFSVMLFIIVFGYYFKL
jgi:hypothetical protein